MNSDSLGIGSYRTIPGSGKSESHLVRYRGTGPGDSPVSVIEYFPSALATRKDEAVVPNKGDDAKLFKHGLDEFIAYGKELQSLEHRHIATNLDLIEKNGTAYQVIEERAGASWAAVLTPLGDKLPEKLALKILLPVINGIGKAHEAGIFHHAVSPDSIYLEENGDSYISGFTPASMTTPENAQHGFSAPERYEPGGTLDGRTDVYSVGACLFRMLVGGDVPDAISRKRSDPVPDLIDVSGIKPQLKYVLKRALELDPTKRPASMAALEGAIMASFTPAEQKGLLQGLQIAPIPAESVEPEVQDSTDVSAILDEQPAGEQQTPETVPPVVDATPPTEPPPVVEAPVASSDVVPELATDDGGEDEKTELIEGLVSEPEPEPHEEHDDEKTEHLSTPASIAMAGAKPEPKEPYVHELGKVQREPVTKETSEKRSPWMLLTSILLPLLLVAAAFYFWPDRESQAPEPPVVEELPEVKSVYETQVEIGDSLWALGELDGALTAFENALADRPGDSIAQGNIEQLDREIRIIREFDQAEDLFGRDEWVEARVRYLTVLELDPERRDARDRVIEIDRLLRPPPVAVVPEPEPEPLPVEPEPEPVKDDYTLAMEEAQRLMSIEQYEEAITSYSAAQGFRPEETSPGDGIIAAREAIRIREMLIAFNAKIAEANEHLARGNYPNGDFDMAIAAYQEAQVINPDDTTVSAMIEAAELARDREKMRLTITDANGYFLSTDEPITEQNASSWRRRAAYPAAAESANLEGVLELRVLVGPDGKAIDATVLSGPDLGFHQSALRAIEYAQFSIPTWLGDPVTAWTQLKVRYSMGQ